MHAALCSRFPLTPLARNCLPLNCCLLLLAHLSLTAPVYSRLFPCTCLCLSHCLLPFGLSLPACLFLAQGSPLAACSVRFHSMSLVCSQLTLPTCLPQSIHLQLHHRFALLAWLCLVQLETSGAVCSQFPLTILAHSRLHAYRPLAMYLPCTSSPQLLCLSCLLPIAYLGCVS